MSDEINLRFGFTFKDLQQMTAAAMKADRQKGQQLLDLWHRAEGFVR